MPSIQERMVAAACAVAFAIIALSGLISHGDHNVRALAIAAAVAGCISQYAFQGSGWVQIMSVYAAVVGFTCSIGALLLFCFST